MAPAAPGQPFTRRFASNAHSSAIREWAATMTTHKVALITGASGSIGAGLVAGYRSRDWAVVASSRTIRRSLEPDLVTVAGDLAEPATADRIVDTALERFGRVDTLVNSAN